MDTAESNRLEDWKFGDRSHFHRSFAMEALFQIGKELGELRARVNAIETKKCGCKDEQGHGAVQLTPQQRAMSDALCAAHDEINAALSKAVTQIMSAKGYKETFEVLAFAVRTAPTPRDHKAMPRDIRPYARVVRVDTTAAAGRVVAVFSADRLIQVRRKRPGPQCYP